MLNQMVPILRMFDEQLAREFYVDFLGFRVDFEHRHAPGMPLYMGLSSGNCAVHLTEHFGDASPGAHIRIEMDGLKAYAQALSDRRYKNANPGKPEERPWGVLELTVTDPFGNRLTFAEPAEDR